jgi:LAS superfamily LD-carboxypeptidase LdcB
VPSSRASRANVVGQSETHLCSAQAAKVVGASIHADVVDPFLALRAAATVAGFDLRIVSGFRSFERQLSIWNRKAAGALPVLDSSARPLDIANVSPAALVPAILRWSALPGASRHHWGSDVDVYDHAAAPVGYEVALVPAEVDPGGMFAGLHAWLDARMASQTAFGFFRPYDADRGGVAPERWHLSCAPVAAEFSSQLTPDVLRATIGAADMALKDVVLANLDDIFERFVTNVNPATG